MRAILHFLENQWIAILALLVSIITLYLTHLKPFSPKIYSAGRYSISINPQNSSQIAISPILVFANEGAKKGVIENLALIIKTPKDEKFLLMPHLILTDLKINTTREKSKSLEAEAFVKFSLGSEEVIVKQVMFIPPSIERFILSPGKYLIDVFAKTSKDKRFEKYNALTIEIDVTDLQEIRKNVPKLKPGESVIVEAFFRNKITPELDQEYQSLLPYLK